MDIKINSHTVEMTSTKQETEKWAVEKQWKCSKISGKSIRTTFDCNGVLDLMVNGKVMGGEDFDISAEEFNAFSFDQLEKKIPHSHPCYFVVVEQYKNKKATENKK